MRSVFGIAALASILILAPSARADELLLSAASSLTDAMNEIGAAYTRSNPGTVVRFNFGASGALQQQITHGAPVDVFVSASPHEMDALQRAGMIDPSTRFDFAGNRLVLITPARSSVRRWEDLRTPSVQRLAISDPASVPSGRYAKETLTKRGLWNSAQPKIINGENVRQTLAYVSGGNVDAGIVFSTDALIEKDRVRVVDTALPGRDHSPIVYPAAVIRRAPNSVAAHRFISFLRSPAAQAVLVRFGFARAGGSVQRAPYLNHPPPLRAGGARTRARRR